MGEGAPVARGWGQAFVGVVPKLLAVGTLGVGREAELALNFDGGGEGRQAGAGHEVCGMCAGE